MIQVLESIHDIESIVSSDRIFAESVCSAVVRFTCTRYGCYSV